MSSETDTASCNLNYSPLNSENLKGLSVGDLYLQVVNNHKVRVQERYQKQACYSS